MQYGIETYEPRVLEILARSFSGYNWRVVVNPRAKHHVTVVLESDTIVLSSQAGLYDLALAASCHDARQWQANAPSKKKLRDKWLTQQVRERLLPQAHGSLRHEFPRLATVAGGNFLPDQSLDGFMVVERNVDLMPLDRIELGKSRVSMSVVPELGYRGTTKDLRWIESAIEHGTLETETIDLFPEFPIVQIPFRIALPARQEIESFERALAHPSVLETAKGIMACTRRKSEVLDELLPKGKLQKSGVDLDHGRLVDSYVAGLIGGEARLFRSKSSQIQPVFKPEQHLMVVQLDLNDICSRGRVFWDESTRTMLGVIKAYANLDVDLIVEAYAAQLAELKDGRRVICHFQLALKSVDEPVTDDFWMRLCTVLRKPMQLPFTATCFQPMAAKRIIGSFRRVASEKNHSNRTVMWLARRGMSKENVPDRTFHSRTAAYLDREFKLLEDELSPGVFDFQPTFLPDEIVDNGSKDGFLSRVYRLGRK